MKGYGIRNEHGLVFEEHTPICTYSHTHCLAVHSLLLPLVVSVSLKRVGIALREFHLESKSSLCKQTGQDNKCSLLKQLISSLKRIGVGYSGLT